MRSTELGYSIAWLLYGPAVTTQMRPNGRHTAGGASVAGGLSSTGIRGTAPQAVRASSEPSGGGTRCSSIWSRFRAGISRILNWTGLITTKATNPATSVSRIGEPTASTSAKLTSCQPESANLKTSLRVYDLVNAGPRNRFTIFSAEGPLIVHNCLALGFGGGVLAFNSMANIYGIDMAPVYPILRETTDAEILGRAAERYEECLDRGDTGTDVLSREAWIASEVTKVLWRNKHPATVALWKGLQDAARDAVQRPGEIVTYACISYLVRRGFLWCRLPSGRCLAYGAPKVQERETPWGTTSESVTALGVNSVTKKWERFALYGGLLTENCLSGLSEVLTDVGWRRITTVDTSMRVWDGLEFVAHGGLAPKGVQETINFGGLWLTPDHEVLTFDGWKPAGDADPEKTPSPRTGFEGASFWSPSRDGVRGVEWLQEPLGYPLRLRIDPNACGVGTFERADEKLRVPSQRSAVRESGNASHVKAPSVCSLALDAGSVPPADASSVGPLRRARDIGLRAVELLCKLLGRHGTKLRVWFDARQARQQRRLLSGELPVGDSPSELAQPEKQSCDSNARGAYAALRSRRSERDWQDHVDVPTPCGLAKRENVRYTGRDEPRLEPVYDLLNCGPRKRFVARGPGGRPFIVHNCVQAIARDLMAHGMLKAERAGYPIVMTVHDEAVADVPNGHGSLAGFEACLCDLPGWAAGLPLVASGYEAKAYKKD